MQSFSREINFESIFNFRDLGGYRATGNRTVAWGRIFRSGNLSSMTGSDLDRLRKEVALCSVLDLRSKFEITNQGIGLLIGSGISHYNISLISDGGDRSKLNPISCSFVTA